MESLPSTALETTNHEQKNNANSPAMETAWFLIGPFGARAKKVEPIARERSLGPEKVARPCCRIGDV